MALSSQIYKANISLANLNTNLYEDINLTLALHPSETEERMMFRLLAFIYSVHERLEFTSGLSNPDLPDIWQKNLVGDIEHWVELGQPDEKKIKKALSRSLVVSVFSYNSYKTEIWFEKLSSKIKQNRKLKIFQFKEVEEGSLSQLIKRSMKLNCMIEDQQIFLSDEDLRVQIDMSQLRYKTLMKP